MRTEKYYGIRIGDPRRHTPYLRITGCDNGVQLFVNKEAANKEIQRAGTTTWKAVKVTLSYAG